MCTQKNTLQNFLTGTIHQQKPQQKFPSDADNIIKELDRAIVEKEDKQPKRKYLGASSLGDSCTRKLQYRYMNHPIDEGKGFPAKTLRTFALGHTIEDMMIMYFRDAGFDLRTEKRGEQFGFETANGEVRGHIDGVICSGPVHLAYPMLWECKSASDKKFKEFVRKGVAEANPVYAAQIALYQAYMNLSDNPCCFTVLNKNTSEIYIELVPFDSALAQATSDKAVNIIKATQAQEMLPRVAQNDDYFACKWCEFRNTCWEKEGVA